MGARASFRFGTTEAPATWAKGPPPHWDYRGPCRMGEGASSAFGLPRPVPHGRGDLLSFGTNEAPAAWARGLFPPLDH